MHTPLGGHNCMQGKKITIQILDRKPQILESLTPRKTAEAPDRLAEFCHWVYSSDRFRGESLDN